jgi:hypothetical protein
MIFSEKQPINYFTSCKLAHRFHAAGLKNVGTEAFLAHANDPLNQHTAFLDLPAMIYTNNLPLNCSLGQLLTDLGRPHTRRR